MAKKYILKPDHIAVLKKLQEIGQPIEARELCQKLNTEYEKLMSGAIFVLSEQGLTKFHERNVVLLSLSGEGKGYLKNGLPERQIFNQFKKGGRKEATVLEFQEETKKEFGFDPKIFFAAIGQMKKKKWVLASKATGKDSLFLNNENPETTSEEDTLSLFKQAENLVLEDLDPKYKEGIDLLYKRTLVAQDKKTLRIIELTEAGKSVKESQIQPQGEEVLQITSDMLKSGTWKTQIDNSEGRKEAQRKRV